MAQSIDTTEVLTTDFLCELFHMAIDNDLICSIVTQYLVVDNLPSKDFQVLLRNLKAYYSSHHKAPTWSIINQMLAHDRQVSRLLEDVDATGDVSYKLEALVEQFELYLRNVRFQKTYKEVGDAYKTGNRGKAFQLWHEFAEWSNSFTLSGDEFVDICGDFALRYSNLKALRESEVRKRPVSKFGMLEIDKLNNNRDLRKQLTCILASTGVGKSHAARFFGVYQAMNGMIVLHIQLEGAKEEVVAAYDAAFCQTKAYRIETARLTPSEEEAFTSKMKGINGNVFVRAFTKFANKITSTDIRNVIVKFIKTHGITPDVIIVDSMDLVASSNRFKSDKEERFDRVRVSQDFKDIAEEFNVWLVTTYQSTIENREILNDETKVLSEYNCAEAKGISRALTHLITLNQSDMERKEGRMRIHIAKSRFFKRDQPTFPINTDYDHEVFYVTPTI